MAFVENINQKAKNDCVTLNAITATIINVNGQEWGVPPPSWSQIGQFGNGVSALGIQACTSDPNSPSQNYIVADQFGHFHTSTGKGAGAWTDRGLIQANASSVRKFLKRPSYILAGTGASSFPVSCKSTNGGISFTTDINFMDTRGVYGFAYDTVADIIVACTTLGGKIWRSTDQGVSFTAVQTLSAVNNWARSLCYDSTNDVLICGAGNGTIWKSADHGLTWVQKQAFSGEFMVYSVIHDPAHDTIIAGTSSNAQFWVSTDAGESYTLKKDLSNDSAETGIHCMEYDPTNQRVWAGTVGRGEVWYSDDGGNTWTRDLQLTPQATTVYDIHYDNSFGADNLLMCTGTTISPYYGTVWLRS